MNTPELCQNAWIFASRKHRGQLYPGSEQLPYLTHIGSVLLELLPALQRDDSLDADTAVCCALLHDVVEDTGTTIKEISENFGKKIATGVLALTKDTSLHGEAAMYDSLERIKKLPHEIWMVKLADRAANLQRPPDHWKREKRPSYAKEGRCILEALGSASAYLANVLEKRIHAWSCSCKASRTVWINVRTTSHCTSVRGCFCMAASRPVQTHGKHGRCNSWRGLIGSGCKLDY